MANLRMPRFVTKGRLQTATVILDSDPGTTFTSADITVTPNTNNEVTVSEPRVVLDTSNLRWEFDFEIDAVGNYTFTLAAANLTGLSGDISRKVACQVYRKDRAVDNPPAKNFGTNIVAIVAEQGDYFAPVVLGSSDFATPAVPTKTEIEGDAVSSYVDGYLYPNVIEFRPPYSLTPVKQFYPVQRMKGNPSPDPTIGGMQMGAGQINFYLDPTTIDFWIKHLLQTTVENSIPFVNQDIVAADQTLTAGTPFLVSSLTDKQPYQLIQAITADPIPPRGLVAAQIGFEVKTTITEANARKLKVSGKDQNGTPLYENVSFFGTAGDIIKTDYWFRDDVVIELLDGTTLEVAGITAEISDVYEHTLKFVSDVSAGLSMEVQEGNKDTPIVYNGMIVSRGIFRLEQIARMQCSVIANEALPRQSMHEVSSGVRGTEGTTLDGFNRLDFHAVPNCGMSFELDDAPAGALGALPIPEDMKGIWRVSGLGLAIDNMIAPPATAYADDFSFPAPVRKSNREMQMQIGVDYSKEANFDQFVNGGLTFKSTIVAGSRPFADTYRCVELTMNNSQMASNPRRVVGALEEIIQQIMIRATIGPSPTGNDECTFRVINTKSAF